MNELKELVRYFSDQKLQHINVLGLSNEEDDLSENLFRKVRNGSINSDQEASEYFFKKNPKYKGYRELKLRLWDKLVNAVLITGSHSNEYTTMQKSYAKLLRYLAVAKILQTNTVHLTTVWIADYVLKRAVQNKFYDCIEEASRLLRDHHAVRTRDKKLYQHYKLINQNALKAIELEQKVLLFYNDMILANQEKHFDVIEFSKKIFAFVKSLETEITECDSFRFHVLIRLVRLTGFSMIHDHESVIKYVQIDVKYFLENHTGYNLSLVALLLQKATSCLKIGKYEKGLATIQECLAFVKKNNTNWFATKHIEFLLRMHSKSYQKALEIFQEVKSNRKLKYIPESMQEDWKVAEAYLAVLKENGKVDTNGKRFRVGKFMNEVPTYSKDKKGKNVSILTAQFLFFLVRGKHDELICRSESLQQYCNRNFKGRDGRSNIALRMLNKIPTCDFKAVRINAHTKELRKRLAQTPYHENKKDYLVEPMKYEDVWELAMSRL
ncbi:MAG: hypothetical protein AAF849_02900 [Bacteroidota bacterium]